MKRTYVRESFTDEELANMKAGKCWCGKPKSEFQKGMRAYCSPDHRTIWQSKIMTWQEFRDEFIREHGEKCDSCGFIACRNSSFSCCFCLYSLSFSACVDSTPQESHFSPCSLMNSSLNSCHVMILDCHIVL